MRPPRESWRLAAEAALELFNLLETILCTEEYTARLDALGKARMAVLEFHTFVNSSEETEKP